jgi:GT2 family glycosyltransferase
MSLVLKSVNALKSLLHLRPVFKVGKSIAYCEQYSLSSSNLLKHLRGFYMLEVSVVNPSKSFVGQLILSSDNHEAELRYALPIKRASLTNRVFKRVCYFDGGYQSLNWLTGDGEIKFDGLEIKLVKLTLKKSVQLMSKKLSVSITSNTPTSMYESYDDFFNRPLGFVSYQEWIDKNEVPVAEEALISCPLISIVLPLYNTKKLWLDDCVQSVLDQSYINWELVVVDDASDSEETLLEVDRLSKYADKRIKVIAREVNGHISAATNTGIDAARGDYIVFLDHDDSLAENALYEIALAISKKPSLKIIYSDEDLTSESGERLTPHFKSSWNYELLLAHNYITHLCCYESGLLHSLGGMRLGYEGAQDYDLLLRASAVIEANDIFHIPKVLYHWRMVEGSTALSADEKSYATLAGLKALKSHLSSLDSSAIAVHCKNKNFYRVNWPLPKVLPKVSIIIPTRDGLDVLKPCIDSLLEITDYKNYEVVILDNGSCKKETIDFLQSISTDSRIAVIRDEGDFNYSRINNEAVAQSTGDYVCLLNNDIEIIDSNWLTEMISLAVRENTGCVGAKLLYPDGTVQHAGVILGLGGYAAHSHRGLPRNAPGYFCRAQIRQQLSAVTGACLVVKRSVYDAVGGLDEAFKVAYNDVDFCLRVQALGFNNIFTPFAELIHHESKTRGEDDSSEKMMRFAQEKDLLSSRWPALIENDPFYNPNLTRAREDFSI